MVNHTTLNNLTASSKEFISSHQTELKISSIINSSVTDSQQQYNCEKKLFHGTFIVCFLLKIYILFKWIFESEVIFFMFYENKKDGPFVWPKMSQSILLSCVLFGIVFTQIAGGYLSISLGPKLVILLAMLVSSAFSILTPLAALYSFHMLILCRFVIGLGQV